MAIWEIWSEGYRITGETGFAQLEGKEEAETFDDAVEKFKQKHPDKVNTREIYLERNEEGIMQIVKVHTIWGCQLFPTESEARWSFG